MKTKATILITCLATIALYFGISYIAGHMQSALAPNVYPAEPQARLETNAKLDRQIQLTPGTMTAEAIINTVRKACDVQIQMQWENKDGSVYFKKSIATDIQTSSANALRLLNNLPFEYSFLVEVGEDGIVYIGDEKWVVKQTRYTKTYYFEDILESLYRSEDYHLLLETIHALKGEDSSYYYDEPIDPEEYIEHLREIIMSNAEADYWHDNGGMVAHMDVIPKAFLIDTVPSHHKQVEAILNMIRQVLRKSMKP